jgi:dTDP-4-dehydrorhamnose 3,5-epimerase
MEIEKTPLEGLLVLKPKVFEDTRGFFFESYNAAEFARAGIHIQWVQDNHALSVRDTLRGLHFQRGPGQPKLVRCTLGVIWDVAVDIRPDSPTLGQWHGMDLSAENKLMLLIPGGFAHGYAVLSDQAEVQYKCGTLYDPKLEDQVQWDDRDLAVRWPVASPILSQRDLSAQSFKEYLKSVGQQ